MDWGGNPVDDKSRSAIACSGNKLYACDATGFLYQPFLEDQYSLCWSGRGRSSLFSVAEAGIAWPGVLAVLLVGWARLYLGVHTVAQVLAGFVLGIGVSLAAYWALM